MANAVILVIDPKTQGSLLLLVILLLGSLGCEQRNAASIACEPKLGQYVSIPGSQSVAGFELLSHEVTNAQFAQFVSATNYVTDAEQGVLARRAGAGSALFSQTDDTLPGAWSLEEGANWRVPEGGVSNLEGRENHPVVHVSYRDAQRYAEWSGGRLPTEQEWQLAAQLGLRDQTDRYSGAFDAAGVPIANTWQGFFPVANDASDGYKLTAPVGCYPASTLGLHDMIGNVWEWTSSPHGEKQHVIKGGSFLCASNFCRRFHPAARQYQDDDFSTNHTGFRVARTAHRS